LILRNGKLNFEIENAFAKMLLLSVGISLAKNDGEKFRMTSIWETDKQCLSKACSHLYMYDN